MSRIHRSSCFAILAVLAASTFVAAQDSTRPEPARYVAGRVTVEATGLGIGGAVVQMTLPDGSKVERLSDENGGYLFRAPQSGLITLCASLPQELAENYWIREGKVPVRLEPAEEIPEKINFRAARKVVLTGRVIDETGRPIPGASVDLNSYYDFHPCQTAVADEAGIFRLKMNTFRDATITADAPGFRRADLSLGELIPGAENMPIPLVLQLRAGREVEVSGRLLDRNGAPIFGELLIAWQDHVAKRMYCLTDENGNYAFRDLDAGAVYISHAPGTGRAPEPEAGQVIRNYDLTFRGEVRPGVIVGRVLDSAGRPVPPFRGEIVVYSQCPNRFALASTTPVEGGRFIANNLPLGGPVDVVYKVSDEFAEWKFTLLPGGTMPVAAPGKYSVAVGSVAQLEKDFICFPMPDNDPLMPHRQGFDSITGRVTGPDGAPVVGAVVRSVPEDFRDLPKSDSTDSEGRFRLTGLSPKLAEMDGEGYRLRIAHAAHALHTTTATRDRVRYGAPVDIRLEEGGTIAGTVTGADGKPVVGARLLFSEQFWSERMQAVTDERGHYSRDHLAAGVYTVSLEEELGFPAGEVSVHDGENAVLEFGDKGSTLVCRLTCDGASVGVICEIIPADSKELRNGIRGAKPNSAGEFTLHELPAGSYLIEPWTETHESDLMGRWGRVPFTIGERQTKRMAFDIRSATIRGEATWDRERYPEALIFADVQWVDLAAEERKSHRTRGDHEGYETVGNCRANEGRYTVSGIPPGEHILTVTLWHDDVTLAEVTRPVTLAQGEIFNFDFDFRQTGELELQVILPPGYSWEDSFTDYLRFKLTDASGLETVREEDWDGVSPLLIRGIEPGDYTIIASNEQYLSLPLSVALRPGQTTRARLRLRRAAEVSFEITGIDESIWNECTIEAWDEGGRPLPGIFFPAGRIRLRISHNGRPLFDGSLDVPPPKEGFLGSEVRIDLGKNRVH